MRAHLFRTVTLAGALALAPGCRRPDFQGTVALERAFPSLVFAQPLVLLEVPGDSTELWLAEREGRVVAFPNHAQTTDDDVRTTVSLTARVDSGGEGGLLGMAFHPDWPTRREVFVSYTEAGAGDSPLRSVVARLRSFDDGTTLDPGSEERILELDQPFSNHNGGNIAFGHDGLLYIGFGDGGDRGDPLGAGQRTDTVLGKMLRIDVDVPAIDRYAIPPGNPFAETGAACQRDSVEHLHPGIGQCAEIYALGFRNPWRWSFDRSSGDLWVGDVGQGAWEEIDHVELGGNYGWNEREGAHCFESSTCQTTGLIDPVVEYGRDLGTTVTAGFVYRGSAIPDLAGSFVFADFGSGRFWAATGGPGTYERSLLVETELSIASFGQLPSGELVALDLVAGTLHTLVPAPTR